MEFRPLGRTGLKVSCLCLGTMTFGEQNSEAEAFAQLDLATSHGINFIDTAELYPIPPRPETQGRTEEIIGKWLKKRGKRDDLIIATKVCGRADWIPHIRGGSGLDRQNIRAACEASLRRLQTDYIDLYQTHWPDRATNFFGRLGYEPVEGEEGAPIEETLEALTELVREGKVRHIGVSNETPWGLHRYLCLAENLGYERVVSIQNPYNLLNRTFEIGLAEFSHREQVGLLAYSPLAFGVLTGKYLGRRRPTGARITLYPQYTRYLTENGVKATEAYVQLARRFGLDPAQMAIRWILDRPFVTSAIIGATNLDQLKTDIASVDLKLPEPLLSEIEKVHRRYPNPCP